MERSVIRFSHCQKEIFCFSVPEDCPSCGEVLRGNRLQEAPVSLPSPFTNGHKSSCCLLIAPAHNNLGREFDGTSDLHTGISNTKGRTQKSRVTGQAGSLILGAHQSAFLIQQPYPNSCYSSKSHLS
ncbi:hypothetical protein INR49_001793 [Caranx melampygus]|nr:hypothetical protein INR49_001793 [Caranx melampygus]